MNTTPSRSRSFGGVLAIVAFAASPAVKGDEPVPTMRLINVKTLTHDQLVTPSTVLLSQDGKVAYVASWENATIAVCTRDSQSGEPKLVTTVTDPEQLGGCVRLALHPSGRFIAATSFQSKTVTLFAADKSGQLNVVDRVQEGVTEEELLNWVVPCVWSPDGGYLYVGDAYYSNGENGRVIVYQFVDNQKLRRIQLRAGDDNSLFNLRDLSCHPDGHTMFATCPGAGSLVVFNRDPENGKIGFRQVLRKGGSVRGLDGVMRHRLSRDRQFVYTVSGRFNGDQSICVFKFSANGELDFVQELRAGENGLPEFNGGNSIEVSNDGRNLYVAFTVSNHLLSFNRNLTTGELSLADSFTDSTPIAIPKGAAGLAITPDDKYLYVCSEHGHSVSVLERGFAKPN